MDETLIKELVKDWQRGNLSSLSAMIALTMIVFPKEPSEDAVTRAKEIVGKIKE